MDAKAGMISYLRFVYGNDKGATKAGQMFNNSLYKGISDPEYSGSFVTDEPLVADQPLSFYPVVPGTLTVTIGENSGTDDGKGKIIVNQVTGEIDYATGKITGLTVGDGSIASYQYDNESAPVKVPQINLELAQVPIFAHSRKLAAYWGFDAAYDLKKQLTYKVA